MAEGGAEGKKEGEFKGNIDAYREMGLSQSETIGKIAERFQLSREKAAKIVEKYWELPKTVQ